MTALAAWLSQSFLRVPFFSRYTKLYKQFILTIFLLFLGQVLSAQSRIDLRNQARNVDFQNAQFTRPVQTGIALPSSCSIGQMFFKIDALPGENLYVCATGPAWLPVGSGGAGSDALAVQQTGATTLSLGFGCSISKPCPVRFGNLAYLIANPGTLTVSAGTGTAFIYVTPLGVLTAASNNLTLSCASCTVVPGATGFPADSIPLYRWGAAAGAWVAESGVDFRARLSQKNITAGAGLLSTELDGTTQLSLDVTQLLTQDGNNSFTGTTTFANNVTFNGSNNFTAGSMTLPSGSTLPANCVAGALYYLTSTLAGANLHSCTATNTWTRMSGVRPVDFSVSQTSTNVLTLGSQCSATQPCTARFGNTLYSFNNSPQVTISAGSGTAYIYVTAGGVLTVGHTGLTLSCDSGCSVTPGVNAFPIDSIPVFRWTASGGSWQNNGGTDQRSLLSQKNVSAGTGLQALESNGTTTLSIDTAMVGIRVNAPSSATAACSVGQWSSDAAFLYICTATNTWRRAGVATW